MRQRSHTTTAASTVLATITRAHVVLHHVFRAALSRVLWSYERGPRFKFAGLTHMGCVHTAGILESELECFSHSHVQMFMHAPLVQLGVQARVATIRFTGVCSVSSLKSSCAVFTRLTRLLFNRFFGGLLTQSHFQVGETDTQLITRVQLVRVCTSLVLLS